MSKKIFKKASLIALLAVLIAVVGLSAAPVKADDTFEIYVRHNINGRSLGLDKALPVDVYVNGANAFSLDFKDAVSTSLPAGNYQFEVKLAGTGTTIMSFGPADIPAGVDVRVLATLSGEKTPTLKVNVK